MVRGKLQFELEALNDFFIGLIDFSGVDRVEIDLGGFVGRMSHTLADDGYGKVHVASDAGPGVTSHVGGKRHFQSNHLAYFFKVAVDVFLHTLILAVLCAIFFQEYGEHVWAILGEVCIAVDDVLLRLFPFHG